MKTKVCSKCGKEKPVSEFYKDKSRKDGLYSHCKKCHNKYTKEWKEKHPEYMKKWYEENSEKQRKYRRKYYEEHKEEQLEKCREWYKNNKEKALKVRREYREEHIEEIREYDRKRSKKRRKENPEEKRERERRWRENNPGYFNTSQYKLNNSMSTGIYESIRDNKKGKHWEDLVGYTLDDLKEHLEEQFEDWMTWDNYGDWEIDHIKPKSLFDYDSPKDEQFKECWALSNLQPLEKIENIKKSNNY